MAISSDQPSIFFRSPSEEVVNELKNRAAGKGRVRLANAGKTEYTHSQILEILSTWEWTVRSSSDIFENGSINFTTSDSTVSTSNNTIVLIFIFMIIIIILVVVVIVNLFDYIFDDVRVIFYL